MKNQKKIIILGSTGSIGTQALEIIEKYPQKFKLIGLTANQNISLLKKQIKKYKPSIIGIPDPQIAKQLAKDFSIKAYSGDHFLEEIVQEKKYNTLINALVGLAGIRPTLAAIYAKKNILLANKETLVAAGEIVMQAARKNKVNIMPIDSEHSALFQCLLGERKENVEKLIITCSGGALIDKTKTELKKVSVKDALGHKTWQMGQKITIDSATLMNKGFEVIEAMHLYNIPIEKIQVVIHRESIIHSMVEYKDASVIAQISPPDMRLPIQYALSYPERFDASSKRFQFDQNLSFARPDLVRFPCLVYAYEAAKIGGTMPAVLNASNDLLVENFLAEKCDYLDIPRIIRKVMQAHQVISKPSLEQIEEVIAWAREKAEEILEKSKKRKKSKIIIKKAIDAPKEVKDNPFYDSEIWGRANSIDDIYIPDFDEAISFAVAAHEIGHLVEEGARDDARLDNFEATRAEEQRAWDKGWFYLEKYISEYYQKKSENILKIKNAFEQIKNYFMEATDLSRDMYLDSGTLNNLDDDIDKILKEKQKDFFLKKGQEFKKIFERIKKEKIGKKPNWIEFTKIVKKAVRDIIEDNNKIKN